MKKNDYPKITIIIRGLSLEQADLIVASMVELDTPFGVEVTLNTDRAFEIITHLSSMYGEKVLIGAGTVRTLEEAEAAVEAGARFLLGPHMFSADILSYCKANQIISVPSAMTPSEVNQMMLQGADIVKIFPATVVTPKFFKDIQAPFGPLPLMAVGGVSEANLVDFFDHGASYVGIGSGMFDKKDIESLNKTGIKASLKKYIVLATKG